MKNILIILALMMTGIQSYGQSSRSVSYTYFHSIVIPDANNGDLCAPGSPNCNGGGMIPTTVTNDCGRQVTYETYTQGTFERYYKTADVNLTTLQSLRYVLKNKTQGNKVIYDFTVSHSGGVWANSTPSVNANPFPGSNFTTIPSIPQTATVTVNNNDGNVKISTPAIPMLFANASDELVQEITPSLRSCTTTVSSADGFNYPEPGCLAVSTIYQDIPGVVVNNGQTSANGATLYDVKFSSESTDKAGWYLLDGRAVTTISNASAQEAARLKFGANLPNTNGLYTVATTVGGQDFNQVGDPDNEIIVQNNNIQSATLTTTTNGSHSHSFTVSRGFDDGNFNGSTAGATDAGQSPYSQSTSSDGNHSHNVTIGTASPTPISIQPSSIKLYQLIYLGE